jgi:hypothetical protein
MRLKDVSTRLNEVDMTKIILPPSSTETERMGVKFPRSSPVRIERGRLFRHCCQPRFLMMVLIMFLGFIVGILISFLFPYNPLSFLPLPHP